MRDLKFTIVYPAYSEGRIKEEEGLVSRLCSFGYDVTLFGIPTYGSWWTYKQLDNFYHRGHPILLESYSKLKRNLENRDVLLSAGGSMLHPDFIKNLSVLTVFSCADDPESSEILSHPVAPAFDVCFVYNLACLDTYRSWGCKNVFPIFHAIRPDSYNKYITKDSILTKNRSYNISIFCDKMIGFKNRMNNIERLLSEFPDALVGGRGWPSGYLPHNKMLSILSETRIGWNLHHSIGPCNTRTTSLPANGILQICDNKDNLNWLFILDKEVVGFNSIDECIQLTHYYLDHENARREIAAAGYERAMQQYTEQKWFEYIINIIYPLYKEKCKL